MRAFALIVLTLAGVCLAQEKKPAELQANLNDLNVMGADFWIYNDLAGAIAEAKKTNKPILVTFRCVPCKACAGFDAEVAKGSDVIAKLAKEKFVSLRQVEMKGVDLSQFQFDYDLNWAAMFINADGTVYGRYGTQSIAGPDAYNSIASLQKAMERVLELHANYEKVKTTLSAKRGPDKPYKTALEMPGLENKEKLKAATARNNCIHCHMVHDAEQNQWRKEGVMSEEKLNRYPLPDNIGLIIDKDDGRKISKVVENSAAAKAFIAEGDEITHVNFQPIISIADIQWVLHNLPNEDQRLSITVNHEGAARAHTLKLEKGWKKTDFLWRGSRWSLRPQPGFWAPQLKEEELKALGNLVPEGTKPLRIQWLNRTPPQGKAAYQAGLREGDVIIAMNGQPFTLTPQEFQMHVRLNHKAGEKLVFTILRNKKAQEIEVPLVE